MKTNVSELDIIFISYDEPNKEYNWANLLSKCPWAKRVDGIFGSDAAHKAAASMSDTQFFVTVDGDNIIRENFLEESFDLKDGMTYSFMAKNSVNSLVYGNGGLKIWDKDVVIQMKTHENSYDEEMQAEPIHLRVDFCWQEDYKQMNQIYSTTYINQSPRQAFRAGFREGVKMTLHNGYKMDRITMEEESHWTNYDRLLVWCSVGTDVVNGLWAIYGTRYGCYLNCLTDWDYTNVRDFEWINNLWENKIVGKIENIRYSDVGETFGELWDETVKLGTILKTQLGLVIADLDVEQSKFYKRIYHLRRGIV